MAKQYHTFYDDTGLIPHDDLDPVIVDAFRLPEETDLLPAEALTVAVVAGRDGKIVVTNSNAFDVNYTLDCGVAALESNRYQDGIIGPNDEKIVIQQSPVYSYPVNILVEEADHTPIVGAQVVARDSNELSAPIQSGVTGPNGRTSGFTLDDGEYAIRASLPGYQFTGNPHIVTVDGATVSVTITGEHIGIGNPPIGKCRIYGYTTRQGVLLKGAKVTVKAIVPFVANSAVYSPVVVSTTSDLETAYFYIDVDKNVPSILELEDGRQTCGEIRFTATADSMNIDELQL